MMAVLYIAFIYPYETFPKNVKYKEPEWLILTEN